MAPARLPQEFVVLLPCFLDLRRELAPQMPRNRRVIGAWPRVREVRVHLGQELASIAAREPFADALADLGLISAHADAGRIHAVSAEPAGRLRQRVAVASAVEAVRRKQVLMDQDPTAVLTRESVANCSLFRHYRRS